MDSTPPIDELVSDREHFSALVYTPLDEALEELKRRRAESGLEKYVDSHLPVGLPDSLKEKPRAVTFRQVVTPNYEVMRFLNIVDMVGGLDPLFFEYREDKFTDNNLWKYSLGNLGFYSGRSKEGNEKIKKIKVIDFNTYRGKKISEVQTLWGQGLIEFHHELFVRTYSKRIGRNSLFDASEWFSQSGGKAIDYYRHFLTLFLRNGILFENFLLDTKEGEFTKNIFLPAFLEVMSGSGHKPLIVALEPTEIESEEFWLCHPTDSISFVNKKLGL